MVWSEKSYRIYTLKPENLWWPDASSFFVQYEYYSHNNNGFGERNDNTHTCNFDRDSIVKIHNHNGWSTFFEYQSRIELTHRGYLLNNKSMLLSEHYYYYEYVFGNLISKSRFRNLCILQANCYGPIVHCLYGIHHLCRVMLRTASFLYKTVKLRPNFYKFVQENNLI